jgi:hypothetical protein
VTDSVVVEVDVAMGTVVVPVVVSGTTVVPVYEVRVLELVTLMLVVEVKLELLEVVVLVCVVVVALMEDEVVDVVIVEEEDVETVDVDVTEVVKGGVTIAGPMLAAAGAPKYDCTANTETSSNRKVSVIARGFFLKPVAS